MVAVIAGNGLGLDNTSLAQLGQAQGGQAAQGQGQIRQYLNIASGNLVLQNQDEGLVFDGLPLHVLRTYNSQGQTTGNQGWLFGFTRSLGSVTGTINTVGSSVSRTDDDGAVVLYAYNASLGAYVSQGQSGASDTLAWNSGSSTWTWTEGASRVQESYNATGQLQTLSDPETGASYNFNYNASGQLSSIVSGDGDTLTVGYTGNLLTSLTISEIPSGGRTAVVRQQVGYSYDAQGRLQTVTTTLGSDTQANATNYTTTYAYDGTSDRVASVTQGDGTTASYTYVQDSNGAYRVNTITTGSGAAAQTVTLGYDLATDTTTVTDALGNTTTYTYNAAGLLTQVVAPSVNGTSPTTQYSYDANGNLLQVIDANGGITAYTYDANGNRLSVEDPAGHTISYTYNADNQVTSQTTYTVPAQGVVGQSGYVPPSGAQTMYYVYDSSDRLNYVIDALGNVTEHDYGTSSGVTVLTSTKKYMGVAYDMTTISPSAPPTLGGMQSWTGGAGVQAALSQMVRTDYSYDVRGQLSQATQWDVLDGNGVGTLTADAGASVTTYSYDAQGRLLHSAKARGTDRTQLQITSYTYDGLGRLLSVTDPLGQVTSYLYDDSHNTLITTQANGATLTQVRNSAGLLVSTVQSASVAGSQATFTLYNVAGQAVATIDPQGHATYTFYDANGRVEGMVGNAGNVTTYNYDANGYRTQTIQYATAVDTTGWISNGALTAAFPANLPIPASSTTDVITFLIHDSVGNVAATIAADGTVTETTYDASGNAIAVTQYATVLTAAQINALGALPTLSAVQADVVPASGDQTSRAIYDQSHRVVATIDPAGHVTTTSYDGAGAVMATLTYGLPLTAAQLSALGNAPTLAALQADLPNIAAQMATLNVYDGSGRVVGTVDGQGYVSTTTYDASGNVIAVRHYDAPLTEAQAVALGVAPTLAALQAAVGASATYTATLTIRDGAGRAIGAVDTQGRVVITAYDGAGNITAQTQYNAALTEAQVMSLGSAPTQTALRALVVTGSSDQTTLNVYDAQERVIAAVTPTYQWWTGQYVGTVTTTAYYANGSIFYSRTYQVTLTQAQVASLGTAPTMTSLNARLSPDGGLPLSGTADGVTMTLYDASGRVAASLVNSPYYANSADVTTYTYDSSGRLIVQHTYQGGLYYTDVRSLMANPSLSYLQAHLATYNNNLITVSVYDSYGRVAGTYYVARYGTYTQTILTIRNSAGNLTKTATYNVLLTSDQFNALVNSPTLATLEGYLVGTESYPQLTVYDDNQRVIGSANGWSSPTTTSYNDAANATVTVAYTNLLTESQLTALGDAPTMAAFQAALSPSSSDQITMTIRDANGHVVGSVDENRLATISQYDAAGNLIQTHQYVTPLTYDQLVALAANPTLASLQSTVSSSVRDEFNLSIYDASNRVVASVDPSGNVTTRTYDGAGGYTVTTTGETPLTYYQYEVLRSDPSLSTLQAMLSTGPNDESTIAFYDNGGRVVAQVASNGTVTTNNYDTAGRLTSSITAASHLTSLQVHELSLAPALPALYADLRIDDGGSQLSQTIFDAAGHPVAQIDASGIVTTMAYDASGNRVASTQYATPLTAGHGYFPSLAVLFTELKASSGDRTARTIYDALQHPVASINASGQVTLISYDAQGNALSSMKYATALTAGQLAALGVAPTLNQLLAIMGPAQGTIFDAAGREVATINASGTIAYTFYDADGRVAERVNGAGAVIAYIYDADGHITAETHYATIINTAAWISQGALTASFPTNLPAPAATSGDRTTRTIYDASGQVVAVIDPAGRVTTNAYDGAGNVIKVTEYAAPLTGTQLVALGLAPSWGTLQADLIGASADRVTRAVYDANQQAVATIDAEGYVTIHSYDATGRVVGTTTYATALSEAQLSVFDADPRLATLLAETTSNPGDQSSRTYYDGTGRNVATVDADGYLTAIAYDDTQHAVTATRYASALSQAQVAGLSGNESITALASLLGGQASSQQTTTVYDADGQVIESTAPDGTVTAYTYDAAGHVLSKTVTPLTGQGTARTERATYDTFGNELSATDATGAVTTYTYNALGQRVSTTDPAGYCTWYYYDAAGRLAYVIQGEPNGNDLNGLGDVTAYTYNAFSEIASTVAYGTRLHLTPHAGQANALDADLASVAQVAAAVAALIPPAGDTNATTTYAYTTQGQLASMVDGDGYQTDYQYDAFGERIQAERQVADPGQRPTAANSEITQFGYGRRGELLSQIDGVGTAAVRSTSTQYDAFGRVASTVDGNGNTISFTYDGLGRQVSRSQIVQGVLRQEAVTYDAFGRVVTQTDALGQVTTYQYDVATHRTVVTTSEGVQLTKVEDAFGDTVSLSDAAGNTTIYTYDGDGRQLTSTDALGAQSVNQYDADGHLMQATDAAGHVVRYSYDAAGRVLTRTVDPQGLHRVTSYSYDGEGRELSVTDPMGIRTVYRYDADGNVLVEITDQGRGATNLVTTYSYDGQGNVLTTTVGEGPDASVTQFVYDALNRLTSKIVDPQGLKITTTYGYDGNDNLVSTIDPLGNARYSIYNEANELAYRIQPFGAQGAKQGALTQYGYDADGHRIFSRVYAAAVATDGLSTALAGGEQASLSAASLLASQASSSADIVSYSVYGADGELRYQIDAQGVVTETRYNTLGQPSETLVYAYPIAIGTTLAGLLQSGGARGVDMQAALSVAGNGDNTARASFYFYDADGRIVYTVKLVRLQGVLTAIVNETRYDAAGNVTASLLYGQGLVPAVVGGSATTASIAQALAAAESPATTRMTQYVYDQAGDRVATVDPNGNVAFAFYDADGRVLRAVDPTGDVTGYVYDGLGHILQKTAYSTTVDTTGWLASGVVTATVADASPDADSYDDHVTLMTYDDQGRLSTVAHDTSYSSAYGDVLTYSYDAASRVIQTVDVDQGGTSAERITRFYYDANGRVVATIDANGCMRTEAYDATGDLVQTTAYATAVDPTLPLSSPLASLIPVSSQDDRVTTQYYDALGQVVGSLDAAGYFTQFTYDTNGRPVATTRYAIAVPGGDRSNLEAIHAALEGAASRVASEQYDSFGDLVVTTNAEGTVTLYDYDELGRAIKTTTAAGSSDARTSETAYDAFGNVIAVRDGLGQATSYTYDAAGQRLTATDALGNITWYVYDASNRLVYTIRGVSDASGNLNALGEVSEAEYDAFGEVVTSEKYAGKIATGEAYVPTMDGVAQAINGIRSSWGGPGVDLDEWVAYEYDSNGNLTWMSDGNNNSSSYSYDGFNDQVYAYKGGLNSNYSYDNLGRVIEQVDGDGYTTLGDQKWRRDAFGDITQSTDRNGVATNYTYNGLGEILTSSLIVQGVQRQTSTNFDAFGRVISKTDALGLTTTYAYDDASRSLVVTAPGGLVTTTIRNREGQAVSLTDAAGRTTTYGYDQDGRLLTTQNADGSQVTNIYDQVGNLLSSQDASGHLINYTYDAAGRVLTQTVDPAGLHLVTSYAYDGRGLTITVTDPAGVVTTFTHDGNGNVSQKVVDAGNVNLETDYSYNALNEVVSADVYGPAGDSEGSTYEYDALGRLTYESTDTGGRASSSYVYDLDGNVLQATDGIGNTTFYLYNEEGERIYTISETGLTARFDPRYGYFSNPPEFAVTQNSYDAVGHMVASTQYGTTLGATIATMVAISDQSITSASAALEQMAALLVHGSSDRTNYVIYNASGQVQYSIDAQGNVTELRYNAKGQVIDTLAYGQAISVSPALADHLSSGTATPQDIQGALGAASDTEATARSTYTFYDSMGRVAYSIRNGQSGGISTAYQYDADGNTVAQLTYGSMVPASLLNSASTTDMIRQYLSGATDVHVTHAVFDDAGRQVYAIDAAGFVTETQYDPDSRVTWTLHYANAIGAPSSWGLADVAAAVVAANPDTSTVRGSGNVYDNVGNVVQTLDTLSSAATGTYTYDARGLKTSYTNRDGQTWTYAYDAYGNLIRETSPPVAVARYNADGSYAGATQDTVTTRYDHDGNGALISQISSTNTSGVSGGAVLYVRDYNGQVALTELLMPNALDPTTGAWIPSQGQAIGLNTSYNAFGQPIAIQDANGNYTYMVYDNDGRLAYEADANGYVTGYTYDAYGEQTNATRYAQAVDPTQLGGAWAPAQGVTVDQINALLQPSAADRSIATTYDAYGNKVAVTQSAVTYTKGDGSTAIGSPKTTYTYDAYGNLTSTSVLQEGSPSGGDAVWATTYSFYDTLGHKTMSVDPMGYVTTWNYNGFGDVTATTEWATPIDTAGLVAGGAKPVAPPAGVPATTGADRVTEFAYDNDGRKTSESVQRTYVDGSGSVVTDWVTTSYAYDGEGRITAINDNGRIAITQYDALGRIVSVTGPQEQVLVANWQALLAANPALDLTSASLYTTASQVVTYAYDLMGNKLVQTSGSTASAQGVSTYYQYDALNHEVASVTPLDGETLSWTSHQAVFKTYDNNGNVLTVQSTLDGNDGATSTVVTTNTYDLAGQLLGTVIQRVDFLSPDKVTSSQYDAFGNIVATGDGIANAVTSTYDNDGNMVSSVDPKTGEIHTYGYNLAGQRVTDTVPLAAAVGGHAQIVYTRDLDGRVIAELAPSTSATSGASTGTIHASYDAWGNVLSSTDAAGNTTTYTYNERNQVVTETEAAVTVVGANGVATTTTPIKTNAYDANGNLVVASDENGNTTHTVYNAVGQDIESTDGAGATTYTSYDALGNAVASQNGNGNITFKNVDGLGRVVQEGDFVLSSSGTTRAAVWRQAYVLDQDGNRLISYDGAGAAYLQSGDTADGQLHANFYGYDSQGHILWSQDAAQRAASTANAHGAEPAGHWTQQPFNPTFSNGGTGWNMLPGWSFGYFGSGPYGPWTALYNGTTGGTSVLYNQDRVPVIPGQTINATAWINVVGNHGGAAVQIQWFDSNGNSLGGPDNEKNSVTAGNGPGASPITATAPPGAAYAIIGVGATNYGDPNNRIYCAGVSWDYVPPAGASNVDTDGSIVVWLPSGSFTQQPSNPDFENGDTGWDKTLGWSIHQQSNTSNGSWVASYNGIGPQTLTNQDRVPVTPGQTITASAQVSLYLAPSGAMAAAGVLILWFDANGNQIGYSAGNVVATDHLGAYHASTVTGTAPAGAAYATVAVSANSNGIGSAVVDAVVWNYQYIPSAPAGVVQDSYVYDRDGNLVSKTTADGDTETWAYNAYGQAIRHVDLSGAVYNYTYDTATGAQIGESDNWSPTAQGQQVPAYVTAPISTPNSSTSTYYADGQLATQAFADGSSCSYSYDANGNMTRKEEVTVDGNGQAVHTVTIITYDSHNRISHVVETNAISGATTVDETYTYDAAGNRREVRATSGGTTQDAWYTYDGDNRLAVSGGALTNGQILVTSSADSYQNAYDADGNIINRITINAAGDTLVQRSYYDSRDELIRADYAVDVTTGGAWRGIEETRTYDASGHVLITNKYYSLGTTLGSQPGHQVDPDSPDGLSGSGTDVGGELDTATVDYYDSVGRLFAEQNFGRTSTWDGTDGSAPTTAPGVNAATFGSLNLQSEVVYQGPNASAGYDADGDVVAYQYRDGNGRVDQYAVTYLRKDGYLQSTTSGQNISGTPNVRPTTSESVYDTRGNMVALAQHTQYAGGTVADTVRVFAYDGSGQIIERRDGTASGSTLNQGTNAAHENQHYVYVNGQQVAHYDEGGTLDVLAQVTAFSNSDSGTGGYVVQAGDTLKSIAQAIYGNASLWYVIAQANALGSDNDLSIGQSLTIPQVTTNANDSTTFKPYNPGEITGSTTPTLPTIAPPPPPSHHHCNAMAAIVVIAVTIAVTAATQGATSDFLAEEFAIATNSTASIAISASAAAAAGNAAGQLTGDIEGIHQGFDWGSVADSALSAGITAGVGAEIPGTGSTFADDAIQGAVSYSSNTIAAAATGQSGHFSWAGLIASSLASGISRPIGPTQADVQQGITGGNLWETAGATIVHDVVDREASVALGDDRVMSWAQIGEDAAGNAIGQLFGGVLRDEVVGGIRAYFQEPAHGVGNALGNAAVAGMSGSAPQANQQWSSGNALSRYNMSDYLIDENGATDEAMAAAVAAGPSFADGYGGGSQGPVGNMPTTLSTDNGSGGSPQSDGSGDHLRLVAPTDPLLAEAQNLAAQVRSDGAPMMGASEKSLDDLMSYVRDYDQLGVSPPGAVTLSSVNVTADVSGLDGDPLPITPPDTTAAPYWVDKGSFASAYDTAVEGFSNSGNGFAQRLTYFALATADAPGMLLEETVRGVLNAPALTMVAARSFQAAAASTNSGQRASYIAQGLGATGQALLGYSVVGAPIEGALARGVLRTEARAATSPTLMAADDAVAAQQLKRIEFDAGQTGAWNSAVNKALEPNSIYVDKATGYSYITDDAGRVAEANGDLTLDAADRNGYQQRIAGGADRLETDQGGHLIASIFGGPGERINLVPMDANLNMGAWRSMEAGWADEVAAGNSVTVQVRPIYTDTSLRPNAFAVTYRVGGEGRPITRFFDNKPGG